MRDDEFLVRMNQLGGPDDPHQSAEVLKVVLEDLGKRLTGNEPHNLAAQLPEAFKAPLTAHTDAESVTDDVDDFLRRTADHLGPDVDPEQARHQVRAVFATLAEAVSAGEIDNVRSQLPAGFGPLFE